MIFSIHFFPILPKDKIFLHQKVRDLLIAFESDNLKSIPLIQHCQHVDKPCFKLYFWLFFQKIKIKFRKFASPIRVTTLIYGNFISEAKISFQLMMIIEWMSLTQNDNSDLNAYDLEWKKLYILNILKEYLGERGQHCIREHHKVGNKASFRELQNLIVV